MDKINQINNILTSYRRCKIALINDTRATDKDILNLVSALCFSDIYVKVFTDGYMLQIFMNKGE